MIEKIKLLQCGLFAFIRWLKNNILKKRCDNKKVLILFQQIFGDAVMISDSLQYYTCLFSSKEGYEVTFVSKPSVKKFMHDVLPLPKDIKFEELDFKRIQTDIKYFKEMVRKYGSDYGMLIIPGTSFSSELFSIISTAKTKVGLLPSIPRTKPFLLVWLQNHAYTSYIRPEKETSMIQRHRMLLNHIGLKNIQGKLPRLLHKDRIIDGQYCVVCPGSSMEFKVWPMERFSKVIDFIIEQYHLNIYLTGGNGEEKYAKRIIELSKYPENITSNIGNTTFEEWSSIIQYATLVLGNDSATIHLAAAARTPAICIAGIYEKLQFFPYTVDVLDQGDFLPETLYVEMQCEYCRTTSYFAGYGNKQCRTRIKSGLCASCIDAITVKQVEDKINDLMKGNVKYELT